MLTACRPRETALGRRCSGFIPPGRPARGGASMAAPSWQDVIGQFDALGTYMPGEELEDHR